MVSSKAHRDVTVALTGVTPNLAPTSFAGSRTAPLTEEAARTLFSPTLSDWRDAVGCSDPLLVPGNAVMVQSDGPKVLIVDAKQTIRTRAVKLGHDLGDKVEILSGLDPTEPLVANPSGSLRDGVEVKAQAQPSKP